MNVRPRMEGGGGKKFTEYRIALAARSRAEAIARTRNARNVFSLRNLPFLVCARIAIADRARLNQLQIATRAPASAHTRAGRAGGRSQASFHLSHVPKATGLPL